MSYIPPGAKWYLAEIVQEFKISGEADNVLHTNLVLVRADSPEEAFHNAEMLGREGDAEYKNPEGRTVIARYRGLHDLNVIHGDLEHGTELIYDKRIGVSEDDLQRYLSCKEDLGVFKATDGLDGR